MQSSLSSNSAAKGAADLRNVCVRKSDRQGRAHATPANLASQSQCMLLIDDGVDVRSSNEMRFLSGWWRVQKLALLPGNRPAAHNEFQTDWYGAKASLCKQGPATGCSVLTQTLQEAELMSCFVASKRGAGLADRGPSSEHQLAEAPRLAAQKAADSAEVCRLGRRSLPASKPP